jgi:hypothetical protein
VAEQFPHASVRRTVHVDLALIDQLDEKLQAAEIHICPKGGHGYGLRRVGGQPVTERPKACEAWKRTREFVIPVLASGMI